MELTVGAILEGKVKSITNFGAFISLPEGKTGMVHISEVANAYVSDIRQHLTERGLELNQKTNIFPLRNGLDFLGFHTYIDDAGRVIRKVRKSSRDRMKRKLRKYAALYQRGEIDREKIAESYTSWRAHALHGDCRQLVAKYDQQFLSIFERRPEHVQEDQHSGRGC